MSTTFPAQAAVRLKFRLAPGRALVSKLSRH